MSYIEEKKINGKTYLYLSNTVRVSKNKYKKIRQYIGNNLSDISEIEYKLNKKIPIRPILKFKQTKLLELIKSNYLNKSNSKIVSNILKTDKYRLYNFIYNTNNIEGNLLSFEDTKGILEKLKKTNKKRKRDEQEVVNMKYCLDYIIQTKDEITLDFILNLHKMEMDNVNKEAGKLRTKQNIVNNYFPPKPEEVPIKMQELVEWYDRAKSKLHPFELAGLMHYKFVKIHPFMDGNGRMSRLLMNHILIKNNYPLLNINTTDKIKYYFVLMEKKEKVGQRKFLKYLLETYIDEYYDKIEQF